MQAFARSGLQAAEYWIVGDGPERKRLEALAQQLGVADRVRFWGALPRHETLRLLGQVHALVHPSLHDSGGWVCLEAMAAGRPVLCLNLGGPATQVTQETGFKVNAYTPDQAVGEMADAMVQIATDQARCLQMGNAAKARVVESFRWKVRIGQIAKYYSDKMYV